MTLDELEEFIDDKYNMEFSNDKIFGEWITVEQELNSLHRALKEPELKDSYEEIKKEIIFMETIKDKGYQMKYMLDTDSCIWGQGWCICKIKNDNYKFVDFYRVI